MIALFAAAEPIIPRFGPFPMPGGPGQWITWTLALAIVLAGMVFYLWRANEEVKDRRGPIIMAVLGLALILLTGMAYWAKGLLLLSLYITMLRPGFVIKRVLWMIPTLVLISIVSFVIIQLPPGDYLTSYIAALQESGENVSAEQAASLRKQYDLDRPMHEQYFRWMFGIANADDARGKNLGKERDAFTKNPGTFGAFASAADGITLAWTKVNDAKGYTVERAVEGTDRWEPVKTVDGKTLKMDDVALVEKTGYRYRLLADTGAGQPAQVGEATATTLGRKWQYVGKGVLQGNFGQSFEWQKPVTEVIGDRIMLTMIISIATLLLTWAIAIPIGIYSAVRQYSVGDYIATGLGFLGLSIPPFLLALILMYIGYAAFGKSVGGLFSPEYQNAYWTTARFMDLLGHLWIPVIVIGISNTAALIRTMRGNLLDELRKQYVITAQAKGLKRIKLLMKYPVRVALNPFVSTLGWILPGIISGETLTAVVLGLPTTGPALLRSLLNQDMFLAGSMVMILAMLTVIGTLLSDLLLLWLDPRIQYEGKEA